MTEVKKLGGYALRYLPGIHEFGYNAQREGNPNLTKAQYAKSITDRGEIHAVRVYEQGHEEKLVILGRSFNELEIPERHKVAAIETFNEDTLRLVFAQNKLMFQMLGIPESNLDEIRASVYAVTVPTFLANYWYLLEQVKLFNIGPTDFFGKADTELGKLPLQSL